MLNWYMFNFQDTNSYIMTLMTYFHDFIMMILFMIMIFIIYIMLWFFLNKFINRQIMHNQLLELIWTLIPMLILVFMAIPSLKILYMVEEIINPFMTLNILGHQWYWSYEYVDFKNLLFDSFMIQDNFIDLGNYRLLEVDNHLIIPYNMNIRFLVSSVDVIHSWAISSLGIKVDATPGRVNQIMSNLNRVGIFYGQCSEICGLNHSFMPIVLESTNLLFFFNWVKNFE
ncbi:cytochrome c oxidase subunit II (mitochondrion) [Aphidius gifuensis]|uniref:Cytochrome c oxidase subunit 2 n=2 Tax=Aphidius TaxID=37852 RepID=A0A7S8CU18_APHGI|nr:cytochrome c oxidase subunit II [Aphidius gifuensis]QPC56172.1 cytochrome c oxidase subunit II [Aphidius gifuensis]WLE65862.1 cytochrome c oxidase subunit II [Aphidius gifuensis]WLE65875.1 cytochrome c oxidase subunit II [Aphidius gifuensis]WLE65888.1 cytochrome c oxidase subunit II [Aphidius gifuensis]WLE65901.1 cytochrome c oxidase subunit II [Aphidius gifuensis]